MLAARSESGAPADKGPQSMPEGSMNPRLRELIQQLGEAIHESVIESEQISGVVQNIRRHGFEVVLMLEATIGLNDMTAEEEAEAEAELEQNGAFTSHDVNFLKSLRISVEGEDTEDASE
jgi:hypothetical protein